MNPAAKIELKETLKELVSVSELKETFQHIHNDVEAVRHLFFFGYAISFTLGGLITLTGYLTFA